MKTCVDIRNEKCSQDKTLLKRSGVTGVDVGYNMTKGKKLTNYVLEYMLKKE